MFKLSTITISSMAINYYIHSDFVSTVLYVYKRREKDWGTYIAAKSS